MMRSNAIRVAMWVALLVLVACSTDGNAPESGEVDSPESNSESHWLSVCATSSDCGGTLTCISNRCTEACVSGTCALGSAECVEDLAFGTAICGVTCSASAPCPNELEATCVDGQCLALSPGGGAAADEPAPTVVQTLALTGDELGTPEGATAIAVHGSESKAYVGLADGALASVDLNTGEMLARIEPPEGLGEAVRRVVVSPTGSQVTVVSPAGIWLANTPLDGPTLPSDAQLLGGDDAVMSPNGQHLFVANSERGTISTYQRLPASGELSLVHELSLDEFESEELSLHIPLFSVPDVEYWLVATASAPGSVVLVERDPDTGELTNPDLLTSDDQASLNGASSVLGCVSSGAIYGASASGSALFRVDVDEDRSLMGSSELIAGPLMSGASAIAANNTCTIVGVTAAERGTLSVFLRGQANQLVWRQTLGGGPAGSVVAMGAPEDVSFRSGTLGIFVASSGPDGGVAGFEIQ